MQGTFNELVYEVKKKQQQHDYTEHLRPNGVFRLQSRKHTLR